MSDDPRGERYVGVCCREWILSYAALGRGTCGICGEAPAWLRPWSEDEEREL